MINLWYSLVILVKSPLWIVLWCFKHKFAAVSLVVILVAIVALGSFNSQVSNKTEPAKAEVPVYASVAIPPTIYIGVTPSRIYYVQAYKAITPTSALLTDYYTWDGLKWAHRTTPPLEAKEIRIEKR